jgi:hypothetical protein
MPTLTLTQFQQALQALHSDWHLSQSAVAGYNQRCLMYKLQDKAKVAL